MSFWTTLKNVFVKKVPETSAAGELNTVDYAKIVRDLLVGCAIASVGFIVEYLGAIDFSSIGLGAWAPALVPVILTGLRYLLQKMKGQ